MIVRGPNLQVLATRNARNGKLLLFGIAESAQRWKFAVSDLNGKLSTIRKEAE
jgi:hypothetical protein